MRTKKAEIASQKKIGDAEPVTVPTEKVPDEVVSVEDIPQVKELFIGNDNKFDEQKYNQ